MLDILIKLFYSCAHFVVEIDEKSSLNGGFVLIRFNDDS